MSLRCRFAVALEIGCLLSEERVASPATLFRVLRELLGVLTHAQLRASRHVSTAGSSVCLVCQRSSTRFLLGRFLWESNRKSPGAVFTGYHAGLFSPGNANIAHFRSVLGPHKSVCSLANGGVYLSRSQVSAAAGPICLSLKWGISQPGKSRSRVGKPGISDSVFPPLGNPGPIFNPHCTHTAVPLLPKLGSETDTSMDDTSSLTRLQTGLCEASTKRK